jgi:Amt family ammonium transporter
MLTLMKRLIAGCAMALAVGGASLSISAPAYAADDAKPAVTAPAAATAAAEAPAAAAPALVPNKADTVWMLLSTALVLLMTLPGLSLFYGGLTRSKNILSIMMQCLVIFSVITVLWAVYGYSLAFTEGSAFIGKFDRLFLAGITPDSVAATFSKGVAIPEFAFMAFQAVFATITCCLIIGAFAERAKFSAVLCFMVLWFTFSYLPIAHMVWFWPGPDDIKDAASLDAMNAKAGWLFQKGVLDFAGGTVVHINAAVAGLVGSFVIGKRIGYGKESMKPHNMVFVMIGAALLWFGWFGFNAGSALEANGTAALAFINTYLATAAAVLGWVFAEWLTRGKPSMLGGASGCVAGLVAITPAAGFVGPMGALAIGVLAGVVCLWGVTGLKKMLGSDDSLDVFGIHGVGGILGAILTGVFAAPSLGGTGVFDYVTDKVTPDYSIVSQLWVQAQGVITTVIWSAVVSYIAFKLVDIIIGLRVPEDQEREGLDVTSHGESAYEG